MNGEPRRLRRVGLLLVVVPLALTALLAPVWLKRLDYFRIRRIEIVGARYIAPGVLQAQLAVDSTLTVWEDLDPLEERVAQHPQVRSARLTRRLPGTLVLRIEENLPVALIPTRDGLHPVDARGTMMPIDPSRTPVDLPILARKDTLALALLAGVRAVDAALYARISEIRWDDRGGMRVLLSGTTVRAAPDCSPARFAEIVPVEQDLARRGLRAVELDLRYRDQVVARIE